MKNPKISVIIPVYNTEKYLRKCIESVVCQSYKDLEIILVNDGSTDGSAAIIDEYAKNDARIVAIHKANEGVSVARNEGIKRATGDFIGFVDSDDWIEPDMYQEMVEAITEGDIDMVICGYFKDTEEISEKMLNQEPMVEKVFGTEQLLRFVFFRDHYKGVAAYSWNKLFKREIVSSNEIFFDNTIRVGEDVLWLVEVSMRMKKICYVPKVLYHYCQRNNSAFHTDDLSKRNDLIRSYEKVISHLEENKIEEDVIEHAKRFLAYHSSNALILAIEQRRYEEMRQFKDIMRKYEDEYVRLNYEYPERIDRFQKLLNS